MGGVGRIAALPFQVQVSGEVAKSALLVRRVALILDRGVVLVGPYSKEHAAYAYQATGSSAAAVKQQ